MSSQDNSIFVLLFCCGHGRRQKNFQGVPTKKKTTTKNITNKPLPGGGGATEKNTKQ